MRVFETSARPHPSPLMSDHRSLITGHSTLRFVISVCLCSILFSVLCPRSAFAHEVRPAYLELRQTGPDTYDALWKVPGQGESLRLGLDGELPGRIGRRHDSHRRPQRNGG
jgi:hypothetical protein